jgi:hypothetical protein
VATQIQGHRESDGHLVFDVKHPGGDPTFFRYSRTDEPCLMLGMCAFKKVPLLVGG